jgi:hypothetical protein
MLTCCRYSTNGSSFLEGDYNAAKIIGTTFIGTGPVVSSSCYLSRSSLVSQVDACHAACVAAQGSRERQGAQHGAMHVLEVIT